jgi:hypothetical protein
MTTTFLDPRNFNNGKLVKEIRRIIPNKNDLPPNSDEILRMFSWLLPRKQEKEYKEINERNLAQKFVNFIPTKPFEEIKRQADLGDPVRNF